MKITFLKKADLDLEKIYEYTVKKHSLEQADVYEDKLNRKIKNLINQPEMGKIYKKNIRVLFCERHSVFYKITDDLIIIGRILHQSQNPNNHKIFNLH